MSSVHCRSDGCSRMLGITYAICPACQTPAHRECWSRLGGCHVCGCGKEPWLAGASPANRRPSSRPLLLAATLIFGLGLFLAREDRSPRPAPRTPPPPAPPSAEPVKDRNAVVPGDGGYATFLDQSCPGSFMLKVVREAKDGTIRIAFPRDEELEVPADWTDPVTKDWTVGRHPTPFGITVEYTASRQLKLVGPGVDAGFSTDFFNPAGIDSVFQRSGGELARLVPPERRKAFKDYLLTTVSTEIERHLGWPAPLLRIGNPRTGSHALLKTDGSVAVNLCGFASLASMTSYYEDLLAQGHPETTLCLRSGDKEWMLKEAIPALRAHWRGPPLAAGAHLHLLPHEAARLGGPVLTLRRVPGPRFGHAPDPTRETAGILEIPEVYPGLPDRAKFVRHRP